jgi:VWFA-related protein
VYVEDMRAALLILAVSVCALSQRIADSESPRRLVQLNVAATDQKGGPVTDLRASDVQLREDGKPQPLVFFRFAGDRRPTPPPAAGEFANRAGITPTVILFDRWNERLMTAASAWGDIDSAIGRMESVDRVYIYFLTNQGQLYPVHPLPPASVDPLTIKPPTPAELRAKLADAIHKLSGFRNVDAHDPVLRANTTLQMLNSLGGQMAVIAGRKNLLWVTHGFPMQIQMEGQWLNFVDNVRKVSVASSQANIAIYAVDESAQGAGADPIGESRATLQMFTGLTGGRWYETGDTDSALAGSLADGRGLYRVAYFSAYRNNDHKEHKIKLDSSRKGVRLQTREGYFGDTPEPVPEPLAEAMLGIAAHSPVDAADIALRVAFTRDAGNGRFTIRAEPSDIFLNHTAGNYVGRIAVGFALYSDVDLEPGPLPFWLNINFNEDQFRKAADGIVIPRDVALNAQTTKVRVIVYDEGLHSLGSVTVPVK